MNASESGLFKVLMWTITTLMGIVTIVAISILQIVVTIKLDFDKHARTQDKQDNYYVNRLYNDSTDIIKLKAENTKIKCVLRKIDPQGFLDEFYDEESFYLFDKANAVLPKNNHDVKSLNK